MVWAGTSTRGLLEGGGAYRQDWRHELQCLRACNTGKPSCALLTGCVPVRTPAGGRTPGELRHGGREGGAEQRHLAVLRAAAEDVKDGAGEPHLEQPGRAAPQELNANKGVVYRWWGTAQSCKIWAGWEQAAG